MEPTTAGGALLAKYGAVAAAFVGSILSLSFLKGLTRKQAAISVMTGFLCSVFTTPLTIAYFGLPADEHSRYGVAFLIGLLAMSLIPAVKAAAERVLAAWGS